MPTDHSGEIVAPTERDLQEARDLVRRGRHWLALTPEDVERGARAVLASPEYRNELALEAERHEADLNGTMDRGDTDG